MNRAAGDAAEETPASSNGWPFPQADRLETVRFVVHAIHHGLRTRPDLEPALSLDARHTRYYLNGAGILGLISHRGGVYRVSERGRRLLATHPGSAAEATLLRQAVRSAPPLEPYAEALEDGVSRSELAQLIKRKEGLATSTARRRARSLLRWYDYLARWQHDPHEPVPREKPGPLAHWLATTLAAYITEVLAALDPDDEDAAAGLQAEVRELAGRWYGAEGRPSPGRSRLRRAAYLTLALAADATAFHQVLAHVDESRLLPAAQAHKVQLRRLVLPAGGPAGEVLGFIHYLASLGELPDRVEVLLPPAAEEWARFHAFLRDKAIPQQSGQLSLEVRYQLPPLSHSSEEIDKTALPPALAYADCIGAVGVLTGRPAAAAAVQLRHQLSAMRQPGMLVVLQPSTGNESLQVLYDYLDGFGQVVADGGWAPWRGQVASLPGQDAQDPHDQLPALTAQGLAAMAAAQEPLESTMLAHHIRAWYPGPEPILPRLQAVPSQHSSRQTRPSAGQISFLD